MVISSLAAIIMPEVSHITKRTSPRSNLTIVNYRG